MSREKPMTLADLKPDPRNSRKHGDRNLGMIEESIREVGTGRSIAIDENDVIIAGNGTVMAAQNAGLTKVKIVDADSDEIVAVRRKGLTAEQKTRMALTDNRSAELSEWDTDVLTAMRDEGLVGDLFTKQEIRDVLGNEDERETQEIRPITIERPVEVAWVLCAIPMSEWPEAQGHIEALQNASVFTSMVMREKP